MNSDSNFPKEVPVDFKKFRSVKDFSFFETNLGYIRNQGANLCAEVRPNSVFLRKAENLKIDRNALCIMKN